LYRHFNIKKGGVAKLDLRAQTTPNSEVMRACQYPSNVGKMSTLTSNCSLKQSIYLSTLIS
jgi:hypothetical protein